MTPAAQAAPSATAMPTLTPTSTPLPTEPPPTPTSVVAVPGWQDLVAHYPQTGQSVVSVIRHDGVWDGDQILENVVLQMLDAAIVQLTGLGDAVAAWAMLFGPGETIGIKVNTISRYTTTPTVAYGVARRLQEAGVPAEQIVLFDRQEWELSSRGFQINQDGPGVRCRGAKGWTDTLSVAGTSQQVHDVLVSCDALINIPALKSHGDAGFTSALKNHYGSISHPGQMHGGYCNPYIAELNAAPVIRDKTRLIVGDFLRSCPYSWNQMTKENLIAMSFDPVAHDTVARQVLVDRRTADGRTADDIVQKGIHLETAFELGLGADAAHSEVKRTILE
jgi:hypothetical protein